MSATVCLWQIKVVCKILVQDDVIMIAATGSGKSLTYWMPVIFVKHGIVVLVTLLKLLGKQFKNVLVKNAVSAISVCCICVVYVSRTFIFFLSVSSEVTP